jgi:hypothetical protein
LDNEWKLVENNGKSLMIIGKITGKTWDIHGTRLLGRFGNFPALGAPAAPWLSDDT